MKITRTKSVKASTSTNRKIGAARVGKTKEVIVLQGNYGYGWDDLAEYDTNQLREVKEDLKSYRENERNASHRTIRRRVPNPNWVDPAKDGMEVESSTSTKSKYTVKASVDDEDTGFSKSDNLIYDREQFVTNLVHEIEDEYRIKVSNDAWGEIMDLARDLSFGKDAEKHGSTSQLILEDTIYDIVEEDTGIVIGSTDITADSDTHTMRDRFINPDDFVFFFNGEELYRGDGDGFSNVIADLCKDESTNQKFQEWCNQYGDPFDFDGTPKDTAYVFTWLVDQERMEQDDFYLDGSGILNFEMCDVSGIVESSTDITAAIGRPNESDDKEYYYALADGVVNAYTTYWNAEIEDMTDLTYEISDSAITFIDNGNVIYIQPTENITPNWDDLDSDIEELSNAVIGSNLSF